MRDWEINVLGMEAGRWVRLVVMVDVVMILEGW